MDIQGFRPKYPLFYFQNLVSGKVYLFAHQKLTRRNAKMKQTLQKGLAVLLVFAMLFTLVPAGAFAAENADKQVNRVLSVDWSGACNMVNIHTVDI